MIIGSGEDYMKGKRVTDLWNSLGVKPKKQLEVEGREKIKDGIKISSTAEWMNKNECAIIFKTW